MTEIVLLAKDIAKNLGYDDSENYNYIEDVFTEYDKLYFNVYYKYKNKKETFYNYFNFCL